MNASVYARINRTQYIHATDRTVVCILTLDNGFAVTGSCQYYGDSPEDIEMAEEFARAEALNALDPIDEFLRLEVTA